MITARAADGSLALLLRAVRIHVGPAQDARQARDRLRPRRGAHPPAARRGPVAGILEHGHATSARSAGRRPARSTSWNGWAASPTGSSARSTAPATPAGPASAASTNFGRDISEETHTFAIEREPGEIRWYVDGDALPSGDARRRRARPVGVRPPVLPAPERGGRRQLRRPGRSRDPLPAIDGRGLHPRLRRARHRGTLRGAVRGRLRRLARDHGSLRRLPAQRAPAGGRPERRLRARDRSGATASCCPRAARARATCGSRAWTWTCPRPPR